MLGFFELATLALEKAKQIVRLPILRIRLDDGSAARCGPAGERGTENREHGKPDPEGIACGRVRGAGKRIQEQIGESLPGEMRFDVHPRSENKAVRLNSPRLRVALQIGGGRFIVAK